MKRIPEDIDPPALSLPLIEEITRIIFGEPVATKPCDVIFVFGGSHPGLWESSAEAYFKGLGRDIIATGGYKPTALRHFSWRDGKTPESDVIKRELVRLGVPEDSIYTESKSTNTYENVRFALEVYDFSTISSVLAVCKSYAVGRQTRTLQAQLNSDVEIIPYPFDTHLGGDGPFITRENWANFPESQAYMFANVLKIHQYGQAGHLVPVECMSDGLETIVQAYFEYIFYETHWIDR